MLKLMFNKNLSNKNQIKIQVVHKLICHLNQERCNHLDNDMFGSRSAAEVVVVHTISMGITASTHTFIS